MKFWTLISLFFLESCVNNHKIFTVKPLRGNVILESNNNLKIKGAYYKINNRENYNYKHEYINTTYSLNIIILYSNGLSISTGMSRENKKLDSNKDSIFVYINETIEKTFRNNLASFTNSEHGGYSITGNNIIIQTIRIYRWGSFFVANYIGEIVNDSTIHISRYELLPDKENRTSKNVDEYYKYLPVIKPDSVVYNRWNSKKWYWANEK